MRKTAVGFFITLIYLLSLSCGEPLGPVSFGWVSKGAIPASYKSTSLNTIGPKGLYGLATVNGTSCIIVFDGSAFHIEYTPVDHETHFAGLAYLGTTGFLAGYRATAHNGLEACLFRNRGGSWEETGTTRDFKNFGDVIPVGGDTCWLQGDSNNVAPYRFLIKYSGGEFSAAPLSFPVGDISYCRDLNAVFACDDNGNGILAGSNDGGLTWHEEKIIPPAPYSIKEVYSISGTSNALYITASVETAGLDYAAILKRTGAPGEGLYEFSYLSWIGPEMLKVEAVAFRGDDHALALGPSTSIYFDGSDWIRESNEKNVLFDRYSLVADPRGGYWCLDTNEGNLVRHP
jgi:hypothetical protein